MKRQISLLLILIITGIPGLFAEVGVASYYGLEACKFNRVESCPTASGKSLKDLIAMDVPYVAMWDVPFNTPVSIKGPKGVGIGIVLDRGPNRRLGRLIDLSEGLFREVCGNPKQGLCTVEVSYGKS